MVWNLAFQCLQINVDSFIRYDSTEFTLAVIGDVLPLHINVSI